MNITEEVSIENSRILVVDDDEIIRKLLRRVLERSGFVVDEAPSGEAAMDCIHAHAPDLILLDVVMDGMDGFSTCRKIKRIEGLKAVPIIFVTGRSDTSSIVEGLDAGGSDYITKPINRHEALARIRNHLKMGVLMRLQGEFIDGLKKANLAKNRIIGMASHDLRNPLSSIRGLSEFLKDLGPLNQEQDEVARTIQTTSDSMLHLLDELLDLSVIESGEERISLKPCCIVDLITSSINIYRFRAKRKNMTLTLDPRGPIPEHLMLDKIQFRRLIDNLLSNAVKYSPHGSAIRMILEMKGEFLQFVVEDEGPGVPADEEYKLFTDFGKTSVKPTDQETSTGLGLSICKKIAESHQGRIYYESRKDRSGARFVLELDTEKLAVANAASLA